MRAASLLFALVLLGLALALFLASRYDYDVVIDLPTEENAAAFVSVGAPDTEEDLHCPVGVEFTGPTSLALLDAATLRVLEIDTAGRALAAVDPIGSLAPGVFPQALAFEGGALWLSLTDGSHGAHLSLPFARGSDGGYAFSGSDSLAERRGGAEARFGAMGLSAEPGRVVYDATPERRQRWDWRESARAPNGDFYAADFSLAGRTLAVAIEGPGGRAPDIALRSPRTLLTAQILRATDAAGLFVAVQSWNPASPNIDVRETVYRIDAASGTVVPYAVPLPENDCVARQHVAVADDGGVYALRVRRDRVSVLRLRPRSSLGELLDRFDAWREGGFKVAELSSVLMPAAHAETLQAYAVKGPDGLWRIERRDVVANACKYLEEAWTPRSANLTAPAGYCACNPKPADQSACTAFWQARGGLKADVATSKLPYNWGGGDTLQAFHDKLAAGGLAGQSCTSARGGAPIATAAGVDCSGFITRALGRPKAEKYGTGNMHKISTTVEAAKLQPGDIVNKVASAGAIGHVRMLLHWVRPANGAPHDKVELIESTNARGGMSAGVYSIAQLTGRESYVARRGKDVVDPQAPLTSVEVSLLCDW